MGSTDALKYTSTFHLKSYPYIDPTQPHLSTAGQTILITGGGSGIGAAIAQSFARSNAEHIVITGRTESTLSATASSLRPNFPSTKVHTFVADVTSASSIDRVFAQVTSSIGPIDVLVNNAGYLPQPAALKDLSDLKDWWKGFEINVLGTANVTRAFLATKPADRPAVVLTVNTAVAHWGRFPGASAYAGSKMAELRIIDSFALENPEVRWISLHPGKVDTDMFTKSGFPRDGLADVALAADSCVWYAGPDAGFLNGRLVWASWDAEELVKRKESIENGTDLTPTLKGVN